LNTNDPKRKVKENLIGCSESSYIKTFKYFEEFKDNHQKNQKFLGYLRFIEHRGDLSHIGSAYVVPAVDNVNVCPSKSRKLKLPALSIENEKAMLKKFKEIAETCLKKYPQTYEEDIKLLETDLTYNERNCIVYRSGEKKIYKEMIEMAELGIEYLEMDYTRASEEYKKCVSNMTYKYYIETILLPLLKKS
jgi:hypothetical protein